MPYVVKVRFSENIGTMSCSTAQVYMVVKVLNNLMELKKRCSTAQILMVVKDTFPSVLDNENCSTPE